MIATTRKKDTGQAGNGGEFGNRQRPESDLELNAIPPKFTPMSPDGRMRLDIDGSDIEVVSGSPFDSRRGIQGRIRVRGELFDVKGKSCGLRCYCDAKLVAVPDEGLPVENGHLSFTEMGEPGSNTVRTMHSMASKRCSAETFGALRERGRIDTHVVYVVTDRSGSTTYGVSADGVGFTFYDTGEEALREHSDGRYLRATPVAQEA